ncbi:hypothetical protein M758_UG230500 [Ceratodon purpureus]|nr:hypothetical protein M758_UG230500 [Ceratodon purpureus]
MYNPSGGKSPQISRETAAPPENLTSHRDPYIRDLRTDKADRDRLGAGKRHWNGDQSSNTTSFQSVTSGASLIGNGFVPRSKPKFQAGHYSGFFAEPGRNGPSLSATGHVDSGLVRRFHRNSYPSGTSPSTKSQGFCGSAGVEYRGSDTEERNNGDQFLPSEDDKEGRDQPLPLHTPQAHSDSLLRIGQRTRPLGSRNWEYPPRIDRENMTRPHGSADLYSSRRKSIVTQFDNEREWSVGDKRSEVGRLERYGIGSRDGRADCEGSNKDVGSSHRWRRERGSSGVISRHSSFTASSRNSEELRGRGSVTVSSVHDFLHASTLSSNQDVDQPSPSKRPRLGWGQGLAKYEKYVDDVSPAAERTNMKGDGEGDTRPTGEEVENSRREPGKVILLGWEHEYKRQHANSFIDSRERCGENEIKTMIREHGVQEVGGQDVRLCGLTEDSLRRVENEKKPILAQEFHAMEGRPASLLIVEASTRVRDENKRAVCNDNEELELHVQNPTPPILVGDSESRRKDDKVASVVLQECHFVVGKGQNLIPSVLVGEPERRQGKIAKSFAVFEISEDVLEGSFRNASSVEPSINAKYDSSISDTLTKAWTKGDISSSSTTVTECEIGGRGIEATVFFSSSPQLELNAEDRDAVSPIEASPEMSSTGRKKHKSPCSHVVIDFLTAAPLLLAESVQLPASSPNLILTSESPLYLQYGEQDVTDMPIVDGSLKEAEVLAESEILTDSESAPTELLIGSESRQNLEAAHLLVHEEKTSLVDPVPLNAMLRTEPTIVPDAASSKPSSSQVREQVFVTTKFDKSLPELVPASAGSLINEISTVYTCASENLSVVDYTVPRDSASQTEDSILETVERVEAEIDLVEKEIARISSELSGDVSLEVCGTHFARVSALDSSSKVSDEDDIPIPMEEDTPESPPCAVDTGVACHSSYQSSSTAASTRLEKSPISSESDTSNTPALLLRGTNITPMAEKEVLKWVHLKLASFEKDSDVYYSRGAGSGSIFLSVGSEELDHSENQFGNELASGGSLLQERNQTMIESFMMENKEKARLSGFLFLHLLPQCFTGTIDQKMFHSSIEAAVWQHNVETHRSIQDRLLAKIAERRHFIKFKERVLTLRYRALKEAWKREQKGLFNRRIHPKTVGRWDCDGRNTHDPPCQRSSLRLRPLSLDRLDGESDAAQAMKALLKNPQVNVLRPVFKMPAMVLDEKERALRRFVSRNGLVENPIAVEMERKTLNPWTAEERKIFAEKFAIHSKKFKEIASYLQHKTTADCVEFYYRNKKSEDFGKSQRGAQLKNRWDYTKTSSTFLTPAAAGIKRKHVANCARIEALSFANIDMKLSYSNNQLQDSEHENPSNYPITISSNLKMLGVILPSGATTETFTSSFISTPCSVSSTAAPPTGQCKEKDPVEKDRVTSRPSILRSSLSEQYLAGLKGTRSTQLRRISDKTATQEDSHWTDAERELFTSAVATYGKEFRLIALHVGTKSQSQCKAFFSKTRKRLCLDELVELFEANEAAAMLVQSFRPDADLAQEMHGSAGVVAEERMDTVSAVNTLESLKEQSKLLANDMSDLSLVADAAAAMEEITLVKPEVPTLDLFSSGKSMTSSQGLACELLKVNQSNFTVLSTLLSEEEDEDSEATKSDGSYHVGIEAETDIVVDQAAAALIGMSEMLTVKSGLKRSKSEAKVETKSSPISIFSRSQSARLPTSYPPSHAVTEANFCLASGRAARHAKERMSSLIACKAFNRDRTQDMHDAYAGTKGRETAGGEPKPRREPTSWTQEEKETFSVILQAHGKNWALLDESLPSKSLTQIKTFFQNSKARSRLPASDKLLTVVRNDVANRKRKADEFDSTRRAVKQKVRGILAPPELDSCTQKGDSRLGSASVTGTTIVGVDILAYAARFGAFPGQLADQDSSMNGMQHLVRQVTSPNTYSQGSTLDGHQVFGPGARPALPSSVVACPHTPGGISQMLSGPGPLNSVGSDLQAVSPGVVPQAGPPAAIHQVAQQVQQILQQQQHLKKQLNLLIQQQASVPPQLLPQHQHATQQTLHAVRPLEEKLHQVVQQLQQHQVVQQLQQQYELQGRGQAPNQVEGHSRLGHFQQQQMMPARGILKVKPTRGALFKPVVDLATSPPSSVLPKQAKSQNEDIQLHHQDHSSLGIGTIPTVTAGIAAGAQENHAKSVVFQDSDTDTDCEVMGSRPMVRDDSYQRMSIVQSTSSGQQRNITQSTTSTLSSDAEQVKSWDVKLFGQSLLSKPPSLPSNLPRCAGNSMQAFLNPNISSPVATPLFSAGTLSMGFRTSESLSSAFGRVGASLIIGEGQQQPASWPGK